MGAIATSFENVTTRHERVDFRAVSDAALVSLDMIAEHYLPRGYRKGREWVSINPTRADARPGSFSLNLDKAVWSDFATGDKGGDAIDLVAYLTNQSKLDAARELQQLLNVPSGSTALTGNVRPIPVIKLALASMPPADALVAPATFPSRTAPDKDGKPRFMKVGEEGPRVRGDEKRRHFYRQGGVAVRIKIIGDGGDAWNVYRVADADGVTGWQYAKPEDFRPLPYFAGPSPFDRVEPIYWTEGEKDVETLSRLGLPAFTFGGTGDGLPDGCGAYVAGKPVVILADNDAPGRKHAEAKATAIYGIAASVRVVHFPDAAEKGDVSDWIVAGNTAPDLAQRAADTGEWTPLATLVPNDSPDSVEQLPPPKSAKDDRYKLPFGYRFRSDGLYCPILTTTTSRTLNFLARSTC